MKTYLRTAMTLLIAGLIVLFAAIIGAILYTNINSQICKILSLLKPGMTRDEAQKTLGSIAPIAVSPYTKNTDRVLLKMCSIPIHNFAYLLSYTPDDRLLKAEYEYLDE